MEGIRPILLDIILNNLDDRKLLLLSLTNKKLHNVIVEIVQSNQTKHRLVDIVCVCDTLFGKNISMFFKTLPIMLANFLLNKCILLRMIKRRLKFVGEDFSDMYMTCALNEILRAIKCNIDAITDGTLSERKIIRLCWKCLFVVSPKCDGLEIKSCPVCNQKTCMICHSKFENLTSKANILSDYGESMYIFTEKNLLSIESWFHLGYYIEKDIKLARFIYKNRKLFKV